jgi:ABC-type nitrate/sulfonate/bicarbonate transport system ATPase subunit
MGHIVIDELTKEFVERRAARRVENSQPDVGAGDRLLVLESINLEFKDGELVCVLGPSGCGKSTLVRIIAGFERVTLGKVVIDGKEVFGPSSDNIFVFQHNGLLPWLTVQENVSLGLRRLKDKKEMARRVQEYIDVVNLTGFENHYPHQLSGGMQRRAELARAIVVNPEVLFMDEPFAGLDFLTRLKMREEVINMHEFLRKTIVFITHDIDEAMAMADRVIVLTDRPANVKLDVKIHAPHPRDFASDHELEEIRRNVYQELGVHHAL